MQAKVVSFSELGTKCWSPRRFNGHCHECETIKQCLKHNDFDCAKEGLINKKRLKAKRHYELAKIELEKARKLEKELMDENKKD